MVEKTLVEEVLLGLFCFVWKKPEGEGSDPVSRREKRKDRLTSKKVCNPILDRDKKCRFGPLNPQTEYPGDDENEIESRVSLVPRISLFAMKLSSSASIVSDDDVGGDDDDDLVQRLIS